MMTTLVDYIANYSKKTRLPVVNFRSLSMLYLLIFALSLR